MGNTLELRWFGDGRLNSEAIAAFDRAGRSVALEFRIDDYFVTSPTVGLKVRGGDTVELKQRISSSGISLRDGRCSGFLQEWSKWTLPVVRTASQDAGDDRSWTSVVKSRRTIRFQLTEGKVQAFDERRPFDAACGLEVADLLAGPDGRTAWTLGLEAFGRADACEELIRQVVEQHLPDDLGLPLTCAHSHSYPEWLCLSAE